MINEDEQHQRPAVVRPKVLLYRPRSDDAIFDGNASYSYDDDGGKGQMSIWEEGCVDTKGNNGECEKSISISRSEEDTSTVNIIVLSTDEEEGGHDDAYTTITDTYRQQDDRNAISWYGTIHKNKNKNIVSWHSTNENKSSNDIMWQLNSSSTLSEFRGVSLKNEHIPLHHNDGDDNSSMSSLTQAPLHDQAHYNLTKNYKISNPQTNQYNNILFPSNILGFHSSNCWYTASKIQFQPNDFTDEQWHSDSAVNEILSTPPMEIVLNKTSTATAATIMKRVDLNVTQSLSDCSSSNDSGKPSRSYDTKKCFIGCLLAIVFIGIILAIPTSIMTRPSGLSLEEEEIKPTPNEYATNVTDYGVIIDREEDVVVPGKSDDLQLLGTDDYMNMTSSPYFFLNLSLATPAPITPARSPLATDGDESEVHDAAATANDETSTPSLRPTLLKMTPILGVPVVARDSNNDDDATADETLTPSPRPTLLKIIPILDLPVTDNMLSRKPTRVDGTQQQNTASPQSTSSPQSNTSTPFSFKPIPRESSIPSTIPSLLPSDEPSQLPTLRIVVNDDDDIVEIPSSHPTTPATKTSITDSLLSGTVAPTYQETTLTALPTGLLTASHPALLTTSFTASPTGSPPVLTASPTKSVLIPTVLPTAVMETNLPTETSTTMFNTCPDEIQDDVAFFVDGDMVSYRTTSPTTITFWKVYECLTENCIVNSLQVGDDWILRGLCVPTIEQLHIHETSGVSALQGPVNCINIYIYNICDLTIFMFLCLFIKPTPVPKSST